MKSLFPPFRRFLHFFHYLTPSLLREVVRRSLRHRINGLSAEIAYNAIFALFPALLALVSAIGLIPWPDSQFHSFLDQAAMIIPIEAVGLLNDFWVSLHASPNQNLFSFSFLIAIWLSANVLSATMAAIDRIHQIPRQYIRPYWKAKIIAISLGFASFLLLLLALTIVGIGDFALKYIAHPRNPIGPLLLQTWNWLSFPTVLSSIALAMGLIYRYGSSYRQRDTPIMPGAILASLLWVFISWLLRIYIAQFGNYNQIYGTIGAVIILLLWLYLSAFAMLLGSQLNVVVGEAMRQSPKLRY
ncbi:YihY/virulence factor BrkB family protein [filamentous cyanobacterium LEGE 11480]|uniref:YihY/virulence factor BrkB family protein n=1 Tax=Romeriopsis navalis LEGE 11480 TaxID=2777977 RepID=A0A928VN69_9CYAN|nr:YihY/virulence factor BrkB family protein [Romeriopsis navalis]MBE9028944.1 YihY/virulence factor BrkB family protein [Romeriopsis navalis LEGE 11480]